MNQNKLNLTDAKTELLQIQSMVITIGIDHIDLMTSARNLGVLPDETLCLSHHISIICKTAHIINAVQSYQNGESDI